MVAFKALCVWLGIAAAASARAGNFQVSPVRVALDDKTRSVLVTLDNRGTTPLRLQIDAHHWDETPDGETLLEPTDEVVVFPSLLELGVGESRAIRVGTTTPADERERTYRIVVEEVPDTTRPTTGVAIRMRLSVPVFVGRRGGAALPRLEAPTVDAGRNLHMSVVNDGDRQFKPLALVAEISDGRGGKVPLRIAGWYVLAHHRRDYVVPLPVRLGSCAPRCCASSRRATRSSTSSRSTTPGARHRRPRNERCHAGLAGRPG